MRYEDLVKRVQDWPYFNEILLGVTPSQALRNQLSRWTKQGKIIRLKKGLYILPQDRRKAGLSKILVSNILYPPSYVSLEFALSFYGLIPEKITTVTAISPKKTKKFKNAVGTFLYHNLKVDLFFGYVKVEDEFGYPVFLATPEKALLDKLYFDSMVREEKSYFLENLRLQNFEGFNIERFRQFSRRMGSHKVNRMLKILIRLIKEKK